MQKLNLESYRTALLVLEVTEIIDCTAEATCLMMLALCSTGFFCSSFILISVQKHSGPVQLKHSLPEEGAYVLLSLSVWSGPTKGKQGVSAFKSWIVLPVWPLLPTLVFNLIQTGLELGDDNGYQILSRKGDD